MMVNGVGRDRWDINLSKLSAQMTKPSMIITRINQRSKMLFLLILTWGIVLDVSIVSVAGSEAVEDVDDKNIETKLFTFLEEIINAKQLSPEQAALVTKCTLGDVDAIYTMARELGAGAGGGNGSLGSNIFGKHDASKEKLSVQLYTYAAEVKDHALSQAKLGRLYAEGIDDVLPQSTSKALHYYKKAGENGHQASLYNVGLILLAEQSSGTPDLVGPMAYFQAAATLRYHHPDMADEKLTVTATAAHAKLSAEALRATDLSLEQVADLFLFGSTEAPLETAVEVLWREAVQALHVTTQQGASSDLKAELVKANNALASIVYDHTDKLSKLQLYLAFDTLNDVLDLIAGMDSKYLADAKRSAETLARIRKEFNLDAEYKEL